MKYTGKFKLNGYGFAARDDGSEVCMESEYYRDWLSAGNTPEPADIPPILIPKSVTMRQARLALMNKGKLKLVQEAVDGMIGAAGDAARIEWEFSSEVVRGQPIVLALAPILDMDESMIDELFIAASAL